MRRTLRANALGLSEIVGSLMLVLIVVAAATAFGAFITSYQKTLQAEQAVTHDRALEDIKVVTAATYLNSSLTTGELLYANFTISSLDQNPIIITGIDLDNQAIKNYTAIELNLVTGMLQPVSIAALGTLTLAANQELTLSFDVSAGGGSSFYDTTFGLTDQSYLQFDAFTQLSNDFRSVFLPPTAIALVGALQSFSGSSPTTVPVFEGQDSIQPGGNSTIVSWSWVAVTVPSGGTTWTGSGEEVAPTLAAATTYAVTLTVTNNFGLIGTDTISFANP